MITFISRGKWDNIVKRMSVCPYEDEVRKNECKKMVSGAVLPNAKGKMRDNEREKSMLSSREYLRFRKNFINGLVQKVLSRCEVCLGKTSHDRLTRSPAVESNELGTQVSTSGLLLCNCH
jgi:pyruvoyl-dependent arginine decarboxylase (PvlArgDC)